MNWKHAVPTLALLAAFAAASAHADMFSDMPEKTKSAYDALVKDKTRDERNAIDRAAAAHSDPAIRVLAYQGITRNYDDKSADLQYYVGQITKEQDPKVLATGLKSLMNNLAHSPELYGFYKKNASHENAEVRQSAMQGLINSNNKAAAGIEAEGLKFLDDPDEKIRAQACRELLRNGNSQALPKVQDMLKSAETSQAAVLGKCAEGLLTLWYDKPFFKKFDAQAYKLTLEYLNKTPRSGDLPAWTVLSTLKETPKDAWKSLAKDYKGSEVTAALAAVAKDPNASKNARENAIAAIAVHGAKADLEALADALKDDPMAKAVEKALQKAK